jgi:hypothetical protein
VRERRRERERERERESQREGDIEFYTLLFLFRPFIIFIHVYSCSRVFLPSQDAEADSSRLALFDCGAKGLLLSPPSSSLSSSLRLSFLPSLV